MNRHKPKRCGRLEIRLKIMYGQGGRLFTTINYLTADEFNRGYRQMRIADVPERKVVLAQISIIGAVPKNVSAVTELSFLQTTEYGEKLTFVATSLEEVKKILKFPIASIRKECKTSLEFEDISEEQFDLTNRLLKLIDPQKIDTLNFGDIQTRTPAPFMKELLNKMTKLNASLMHLSVINCQTDDFTDRLVFDVLRKAGHPTVIMRAPPRAFANIIRQWADHNHMAQKKSFFIHFIEPYGIEDYVESLQSLDRFGCKMTLRTDECFFMLHKSNRSLAECSIGRKHILAIFRKIKFDEVHCQEITSKIVPWDRWNATDWP